MRHRGHFEHRPTEAPDDLLADEVGQFTRVGHVDLVEHHCPRALGQIAQRRIALQRRGIRGQLGFQRLDVGDRVAAGLQRRAVDDVHQHRAPLDVPQEIQAETAAFGRTRDQPRHIGDGERVIPADTTPRLGASGERIVAIFGLAAEMTDTNDDLPADGNPTRPMSATVLSSNVRSRTWPFSPSSAKPGALRARDARAALPSPPRPPAAASNRVPAPPGRPAACPSRRARRCRREP